MPNESLLKSKNKRTKNEVKVHYRDRDQDTILNASLYESLDTGGQVCLYVTPKLYLKQGLQQHLGMSGACFKVCTAKEARLVLTRLTQWAESMKRELEAGQ